MAELVGRLAKRTRHAVVGVPIDAIGIDRLGQFDDRQPIAFLHVVSAVIPRHRRQKYLDAARMKVGHCLS